MADPDLLFATLACSAWVASVAVTGAALSLGMAPEEYFSRLSLELEREALTW